MAKSDGPRPRSHIPPPPGSSTEYLADNAGAIQTAGIGAGSDGDVWLGLGFVAYLLRSVWILCITTVLWKKLAD